MPVTPMGGRDVPVRRGLYGLLGANTISLSGTRLSMIAIPWFVISSTGSATLTGVVAATQTAPYVLAKALAGPLVDRLGSRRVVVTCEILSGVVVAVIALAELLGLLPIAVLLGAVAVLGVTSGPADGAKGALVPVIAEDARVPLERVTGLYGTIERLATTVGTAAAGTVVAAVGAIPALWITAITFPLAAVVIGATAPRPEPTVDPERYLTQLRDGLRFIWRDRLLRSMYAVLSATNLLDAAVFSVLLPVWAHQTGHGPAAIGLLAGVMSGAAIASSLLAAAIGHRLPRRMTYLVGFIIAGLPRFAVLAFDVPLPVSVAVFAISGLGAGILNPILGAVIFERIPVAIVGRISSMGTSLAWTGIPFGALVGGGLVALAGLNPALLICGIAYFVVTTLPGLQREWHQIERAPATGPAPGDHDGDREVH